ncbi:hypothetical protein L204_100465 [Cryptococcus depauperatus]|nr:hypothetical protein L204_06359 [Cryptococcus depauperatus CBS 7855]
MAEQEQAIPDAAVIIDQLQSIDNVEANLADIAATVVVSKSQDSTEDSGVTEAERKDQTQADLLDNAEALETILEAAIPSAPAPAPVVPAPTVPVATAAMSASQDQAPVLEPTTSDVVHEVAFPLHKDEGISVVDKTAVPPEGSMEEVPETTEQLSAPPVASIIPPAANGLAEESSRAIHAVQQANRNSPLIAQVVADSATGTAAWAPPPAPVSATLLPLGLTENSLSVKQNTDLIQIWQADPRNPELILALFNWSVEKTEVEDARVWYSVLAADNPTASQPLLALINLELALSNFNEVETIFSNTLKGNGGITTATDVSIWMAYLHYIRRQNPLSGGASNDTVRTTISQAYEFALQECGFDRESGEIWDEYIKFIASGSATNQWETQAKNDNLRKVYRRAVVIPLNNIEALWKSYDTFETTLSKLTSKKFLAEKSPAYMTARTALRELRILTDRIPKRTIPPRPTFTEQDRQSVGAWKAYLKWEENNPLVIEEPAVLESRIGYALKKCLSDMRHFPELWYYASAYYSKIGKNDQAVEILKHGVEACPKSFLLTFALAEAEENHKNYSACHSLYTFLIDRLNPDVDELRNKTAREVQAAQGPPIPGAENAVVGKIGNLDEDSNEAQQIQVLVEEREKRGQLVAEARAKDVEELMISISVVWNMYMRFARRAEGIKSARSVFGKARRSAHLTWHVFEASALVEYHSNKDSAVAIRIFELGLKQFSEDADYVIKYLQFLLSINDDNNARALFERSASKLLAGKARPLWDFWATYEYTYGDLSAVHKLENRFAEVFPNDAPLKRFAQRWTYNGIDEIAIRDLGFNRARAAQSVTTTAPPAPMSSLPSTIPPQLPIASTPPMIMSGSQESHKRAAPDTDPGPIDTVASRSPKRLRGPSPRRFDRERDNRAPSTRYSRDPPTKRSLTPGNNISVQYGSPSTYQIPASDRDPSGLEKPLTWFMSQLPHARAFNGPIFKADDIMNVFNSVSIPNGSVPAVPARGLPPPHLVHPTRNYHEPERDTRYGGPPRGRY